MTLPFITIAIPIYNAKQYLRDAIQSVINQTYRNWELLLMCDGSTDGSDAIAEEMAAKDSRISVVNDHWNRGLIYRLNESVLMARGELYARMDADDIMVVNRIEEEVKMLVDHPELDVVGSSIMTIDNNNEIIGSGYNHGKVSGFIHPTVMGHTEWFRRNPYADWALRAEDAELWIRTNRTSVFFAIDRPLMFYREFGVPTFNKYCLTVRSVLKLYRRYKTYNMSFAWCCKNTIVLSLKVCVYAFFALIGKMDCAIALRRRAEVPDELKLTKDDLLKAICNSALG